MTPIGNGLTNPRRSPHQNLPNAEEVSILLRVNALTLYIFRPEQYKPLSGEFGHGYRRLVKRDKQSGRVSLRIRISRHPYFVQMRRVVGRSRNFRPDRQNLLDAIFPLLISVADRSTNIVTMNVSRLANELSPKDEDGNVIPETTVTVRRVCTLIQELIRFGLLELPEGVQWDSFNRYWYPKHVVLSEQFWKLVGVNIDKLYAQQQERLMAEADGLLAPGEEISVSAARKRCMNVCDTQHLCVGERMP